MSRPGRAVLVAGFTVLCLIWGTTWAAIRIGLEGIPPFTGVAARFAIAAIILLVYARIVGLRLGRSRRERALWIVNALLSFCVAYGAVYWAEQWVPSGLGSVLFATYTLMVAVISHFAIPGERLTAASVVGIVLGFVGLGVIFAGDFEALGGRQVLVASFVFLLSPLAASFATVAVKRFGSGIHPVSLTSVPMGITAGVMGALALTVERDRDVTIDVVSVSALLYLAILGTAVTFTLYYWLLARMTATRVALVAYITPVVAVYVGYALLDEPVTPRTLLGSALVLVGVALTVQAPGRRPTP